MNRASTAERSLGSGPPLGFGQGPISPRLDFGSDIMKNKREGFAGVLCCRAAIGGHRLPSYGVVKCRFGHEQSAWILRLPQESESGEGVCGISHRAAIDGGVLRRIGATAALRCRNWRLFWLGMILEQFEFASVFWECRGSTAFLALATSYLTSMLFTSDAEWKTMVAAMLMQRIL